MTTNLARAGAHLQAEVRALRPPPPIVLDVDSIPLALRDDTGALEC